MDDPRLESIMELAREFARDSELREREMCAAIAHSFALKYDIPCKCAEEIEAAIRSRK